MMSMIDHNAAVDAGLAIILMKTWVNGSMCWYGHYDFDDVDDISLIQDIEPNDVIRWLDETGFSSNVTVGEIGINGLLTFDSTFECSLFKQAFNVKSWKIRAGAGFLE